jgi:hypothetical protein
MAQLVVVPAAEGAATAEGYDLRLGPLRFVCPLDRIGEGVGDTLENVGAALVPAERRPRALKLKLAVRAADHEQQPTAVGLRLRRQARQLLDNARYRMGGLYLLWDADPDLDGWLLVGGGELTETDPGVGFGDFDLELNDCYVVGRPGTHRAARRLDLADRRTGLVPRDSRGLVYVTDHSAHPLLSAPLAIPGDVVDVLGAQQRQPTTNTAGHVRQSRTFWRNVSAANGEAVSYRPDPILLPDRRTAHVEADDLGAVRAWDLSDAAEYPPNPATYARIRDDRPDTYYGWERLYGDALDAEAPLALDNGVCRVVWLGPGPAQGLAVEFYDSSLGAFRRDLRAAAGQNAGEAQIVELTSERGVIEWRSGPRALRAILQRGWWGPRLEAYHDAAIGSSDAQLEVVSADGGALTPGSTTPSWVDTLAVTPPVHATNLAINPSFETVTTDWGTSGNFGGANNVTWSRVNDVAAVGSFVAHVLASDSTAAGQTAGLVTTIANKPTTPGATVTARARVRPVGTAPVQLFVQFYAADATTPVGARVSLGTASAAAWTDLGGTLTTPAGAERMRLEVRAVATAAGQTCSFLFDAVLLNVDRPGVAYFDGSSSNAAWTGTPHASASVLYARSPATFLVARATNDTTRDTTLTALNGPGVRYRRARAAVVQLAPPPGPGAADLASLALADARGEPVLVARGR